MNADEGFSFFCVMFYAVNVRLCVKWKTNQANKPKLDVV